MICRHTPARRQSPLFGLGHACPLHRYHIDYDCAALAPIPWSIDYAARHAEQELSARCRLQMRPEVQFLPSLASLFYPVEAAYAEAFPRLMTRRQAAASIRPPMTGYHY